MIDRGPVLGRHPRRPALALPHRRLSRLKLIGGAALACSVVLTVSLTSQAVAAERTRIATVERRLDAARRDYAVVAREYDIRSGPGALARLEIAPLGLTTPRARQYLVGLDGLDPLARPSPPRDRLALR